MKRLIRLALAAVVVVVTPGVALAWGNTGHRIIGETAVAALPTDLPAFLRTPQAALDVGEYSREPDRLKGAGKLFDNEHSPAHFVDLGDDGKIFGGPALSALPPLREDYDT
ncbi:MAG: S1/P1 Nuclease, partial [Phenylobacterium sp.]